MKRDLAFPAIPAVYAAGLLALFTGPFFAGHNDQGRRVSATLADYRERLAIFEDEWIVYLAMIGVLVAVAAAHFLPSRWRWIRLPLITLGSLTGLALPVLFYLEYGNGVTVVSYFSLWGWGLWIYVGACISAITVVGYNANAGKNDLTS